MATKKKKGAPPPPPPPPSPAPSPDLLSAVEPPPIVQEEAEVVPPPEVAAKSVDDLVITDEDEDAGKAPEGKGEVATPEVATRVISEPSPQHEAELAPTPAPVDPMLQRMMEMMEQQMADNADLRAELQGLKNQVATVPGASAPAEIRNIDLRPKTYDEVDREPEPPGGYFARVKCYDESIGHKLKGTSILLPNGKWARLQGGTGLPGDIPDWAGPMGKNEALAFARARQNGRNPMSPMACDVVTLEQKREIDARESTQRQSMSGMGGMYQGDTQGLGVGGSAVHPQTQVLVRGGDKGTVSATAAADLGMASLARGGAMAPASAQNRFGLDGPAQQLAGNVVDQVPAGGGNKPIELERVGTPSASRQRQSETMIAAIHNDLGGELPGGAANMQPGHRRP
jgi:hypothetical protein